ncbi:STAS/SEC14 domain-containing protein [Pontixanthobacter aestiaquae]|uniref:SpoIIAA-like n=1 Tax=Pontixanthobacter aestiaquae TaxID=1509367 RepID=A0A844ZAC5_9SPHN|nr:STAS/SEC14 domain-containing protein [Pontixanthobacter aestiaquae]MDN3644986.1 STAS/SEC14 domain-containing protein [Pontixanthobacter aestiaquae]MXO84013.1 hypothetical protein [Pontixanthobacter aestiaquae]
MTLAPTFSVSTVPNRKEVHYSASGLWTLEKLPELEAALFEGSKEFIERKRSFRVMGDLRDFAVQTRPVAEQMEQIQIASAKFGVERMALICSSMLVRKQFERVSEAVNFEIFDNEATALDWLRRRF